MSVHAHIHNKTHTQPTFFDYIVNITAVVGPFLGIPQILQIFNEQNASGVSLLSFVAFCAYSVIFLIYGVIHKVLPLIISQTLWLIVYGIVVIGVLIYG